MSSTLSVAEVLAGLEARVAHLEEREKLHALQEVHHREQRVACTQELEKVRETLDSFRTVSAFAVDLALPPVAAAPDLPRVEAESRRSGRLMASRLIRAVVENQGAQPFQATDIAAEVNRLFGDRLRRPLDKREAGNILRRMRDEGALYIVQSGRAFHETLYAKRERQASAARVP